jgi:periplasmic protein TonB
MPARRDTAQYVSDATALVLTAAMAVMLLATGQSLLQNVLPRAAKSDRGIELTVQLAPPEAPPVPPPPAPPRVRTHRTLPQPTPAPLDPLPVEQEPVPVDAVPMAAYEPAAAPAGEARPDLEAQYAAELRADIERRKHPPDSPQYRLRHPAGEVRVRFVVLRSGDAEAVAVLSSSGSAILDAEALKLVSSGHYPAMPAKAFPGEARHPFVVTIEFPPALVMP